MPKRKNRLRKSAAVKKAAALWSVRAVIRSLNQVELLRGARVMRADGRSTVPIDWMGAAIVEDVRGQQSPISTYAAGIKVPYRQAINDLSGLGLSREDIRQCKCCRRWFLASSQKAEVCAGCRSRKWPAMYRRLYRAELNRQAGIKTRRGRRAK